MEWHGTECDSRRNGMALGNIERSGCLLACLPDRRLLARGPNRVCGTGFASLDRDATHTILRTQSKANQTNSTIATTNRRIDTGRPPQLVDRGNEAFLVCRTATEQTEQQTFGMASDYSLRGLRMNENKIMTGTKESIAIQFRVAIVARPDLPAVSNTHFKHRMYW
mmetsp:Transcript_6191/g.17631  ORF Transcript_6191/g.17631 Transcript_6191/m.17631 type:complete len:166 (-) Transcript_6191:1669-2166(-)